MGDPRRLKKKYKSPNKLWDKKRLEEELKLIGEYGLRNKKEIWRHKSYLSKIRQQGREIQAKPLEHQKEPKEKLIGRLHRLGIIDESQDTIDDVLNLGLKDICNRRLQTFVFKLGLASTPNQARQMIVHKHVAIDGQIVNSPSHLVKKSEETLINYSPRSAFNNSEHPVRQRAMELSEGNSKDIKAEEIGE
ncbi:MAG: 30S ribosomal protein S4 [Promethearchaeota archaeon]